MFFEKNQKNFINSTKNDEHLCRLSQKAGVRGYLCRLLRKKVFS